MNPSFDRLMDAATRLTRPGNLQAATAAIQAALRRAKAPARRAAFAAGNENSVVDIQARELAEGHAPATAHLPPAGQPRAQAGEFTGGSYTDASGTLAYKLYSPPGYCGKALPLVVMLHGCTQSPDDFAAGTGMNDAALAHGYFVLYPAQAQRANPSRCWNWFKPNHQQRGRGEPALLAAMTHSVIERCQIDPQRVYVAGLSAGGAMAAILGDAYPQVVCRGRGALGFANRLGERHDVGVRSNEGRCCCARRIDTFRPADHRLPRRPGWHSAPGQRRACRKCRVRSHGGPHRTL